MGTLFVDKLDPQSGTSLEIGSSGDTITIPSGATIANSGTATGFGQDNTPAFFAYTPNSYQAISTGTWTSPNLTNELFDTANAFNTTDKKFTPQVAGKYMFFGNIGTDGNWATLARLRISKNDNSVGGDEVRNVNIITASEGVHVSGMLTLNGSSDFVRMQVYHENGGNVNMINQGMLNYFGGFLVTTT